MTTTGFDTWGSGPPPAAAKAAGMAFRTWYSSFDGSKDGPVSGPGDYAAAGIWSVTNFETTIDRVLTGGPAGGRQDMIHAINEYSPRGMPQGAAVILSADEPIPASAFPQALAYYQGARAAAAGRYLTGAYGEQALIAYLKQHGAVEIGWRSMSTAWPGGASTAYCDLIQTGASTIGGIPVDLDTALIPFYGQWMPGKLATGGTMPLTPADGAVVAEQTENRALGTIAAPATTVPKATSLGVETASNPARWAALNARLDALSAKITAPVPVNLDLAALETLIEQHLAAGSVPGVIAAAVLQHLSADTAKG